MNQALCDHPLLVSGYFGKHIRTVYPAPADSEAIFFSNNAEFEPDVRARGWRFLFAPNHPVSDDYAVSSLQAKYPKFLRFLGDYPEFSRFGHIIYFDHTVYWKPADTAWVQKRHLPGKPAFLLRHQALDRTIESELRNAAEQPRYEQAMEATRAWLAGLLPSGISLDARVDATTIISYKSYESILPLLDQVYEVMHRLRQPECQIIWSCLAQRYPDLIQRAEWGELDPAWRVPLEGKRARRVRQLKQAIKALIPRGAFTRGPNG